MKKIFKWSFAVVLGSIGLTSCLKDDILLDPDKTTNVIELVNTSVPISPITSEIIAFGNSFVASAESPLDIVMALLIDKNVPGVGHRKIFLTDYKTVGVSIMPHKTCRNNAVIDFGY